MNVAVIDYGMGNIGSIINMMKKIGHQGTIVNNPNQLDDFDRIILPGVGSFDNAITKLDSLGFLEGLSRTVEREDMKLLGICLGMQLLATGSEEGTMNGLNFIPGTVRKFQLSPSFKVPHMGWNVVRPNSHNPLLNGLEVNKFYFVHSYYFEPDNPENAIGYTPYEVDFVSMVNSKNVSGAQFHPEKSHRYGMLLLKNFIELL
ncbi:MAG: imidazole glycerol phosphate synthase subunit HisH [Flavobacteriales bacterium]|nr:imidazole glycerol phosphate synthase subunit HisH [Bacteroidota bacterium]MCB9239871.1 imidazole glycerol phosphate synthase subunit HisH [Flavobacteriales bacterium]